MARTAAVTVPTGTLPDAIKTAFSMIYGHESQIAALKAKYITPKADEVTAAWRGLKKDTGIERKDLKLFYDIYKRQRLAEDLADEIDRERILDNLRMAFNALQQGEMLSFLDAMEAANDGLAEAASDADDGEGQSDGAGDGDDEKGGATYSGGWDEPGEPAALDGGAEGEAPADDADSIDGPVADAGEVAVHDPADDDALAGGGVIYNEGAQAALDGVERGACPYTEPSASASLWLQGYDDTVGPVAVADDDVAAAFGDAPAEEAEDATEPHGAYPVFADPTPDAMKCYPVYGDDGEIVHTASTPEAWVKSAIEAVAFVEGVAGLEAFAKANERHVSPMMPLAQWSTLTGPLIDAIAARRKEIKAESTVVQGDFGGESAVAVH